MSPSVMNVKLVIATLLFGTIQTVAAQQSFQNLTVDGESRRYLLYLPTNFDPAENLPVMMWFHGGGGTANGGVFEADFRSLANTERFIVVYAEAIPDVPEGCTCWGYDSGAGESNGNYQKDLAYTSAMIDDLENSYNADRRRIYAGGYSMGASFAWDLSCAASEQIAAIAPVAASTYLWTFENCGDTSPTAICHILGTEDFYAPYNGASWVPSVAEQNAFWVAKNQSTPTEEVVNLGGGVTRYTWGAGSGCHGVQHFRRQGGGHDVPGFATSAIWEFVSAYDIDGEIGCGGPRPCCFFDGSCSIALPADCSAIGGTSTTGDSCDPKPCPEPTAGACCFGSNCSLLSPDACSNIGGAFTGLGSVCETGCTPAACCLGESCVILAPGACDSAGGTFNGGDCAQSTCAIAIPGDVDGDGTVGLNDLIRVLGVWGICSGCPEDLVEDGVVGLNDLVVILSNWSS
ncbi:MAG: hypothetical protein CMJ28_00945 [Phycisphaerae bacterium]|nr:hypothetical protein [Phycisphaerae bacterium]